MNALKPEWNISCLALVAGEDSISEKEYVKNTISIIENEKAFLTKELSALGFTVFDSDTNFMLTRLPLSLLTTAHSHLEGNSITDRLARDYGILVRNCSNFSGLDNSYFRIAVRNHDENVALIDALKRYFNVQCNRCGMYATITDQDLRKDMYNYKETRHTF